MASAKQNIPRNNKESSCWRKYIISGDAQHIPKILEYLNDIILGKATSNSFVIKIISERSISIELQFDDSEEIRLLQKYKSNADYFCIITNNSTKSELHLFIEKTVIFTSTERTFHLSIHASSEQLKYALAETIFNYISIFSLCRSNLLTLGLYLHFSILNCISSILGKDQMKNGLLVDCYLNDSRQMRFCPENEYIANKEAIRTITKNVFTNETDTKTKWLTPFTDTLYNWLKNEPIDENSCDSLIINCKLREQINSILDLSSREIHTLYYFIAKEIFNEETIRSNSKIGKS